MLNKIPEQFDIMITTSCNAKCPFCVQEATYKPTKTERLKFIKNLSKHFADFYALGGRRVVITGGEPLLAIEQVLEVLKILNKYPDLSVKAIYTNGERLLTKATHKSNSNQTIAELLAKENLGCINLSVHHYDNKINNTIFRLPQKPSTEAITEHIISCEIPFRLNLTLQKGGISNFEDLLYFIKWGISLGVQDIYIRELFQLNLQESVGRSGINSLAFTQDNYISASEIIFELKQHQDFEYLEQKQEDLRDKTEWEFRHIPTGKIIYLSRLVIGTENSQGLPYLVFMPDGKLYKGWLGQQHLVKDLMEDFYESATSINQVTSV